MINRKYLNISEVSKMLQIAEHKIRYWDSIDPQTKKYRVDGISTKSNGGTRYFNRENIKKLQKLKDILYDGKKQNYTIKLAEKILSSKNLTPQKEQIITNHQDSNKDEKVEQILFKMRLLLKNINIK
tara:strand:+ start:1185 stop:1565 length:381 start_codon:yes stop_codon:yes gene_type:complete